jgi:uncharacterized protein
MTATAGTTTVELPIPLRARLAKLKQHPRQPYHEVIGLALDLLERRQQRTPDPLVVKHAAALRMAARRNKLTKIWVFGSRARGDARPDSDVDILYQAPKGVSLWEVSAFMADAMEILGRKVDLVDIDHVRPAFRDRVLTEAVPI